MKITDAFLQELKYRNNLEEAVSRYVQLKRRGSVLVGLCPFHSEKTPSFTIYDAENMFHCFGCGAGGDVITFTMRIENLDYLSAVTRLAEQARIPLPEDDGGYSAPRIKNTRLYELNREAALFFHENLKGEGGEAAREYLSGRGILPPTVRHFGLGWTGGSASGLTERLAGLGYTTEELKAGSLCALSKSGAPYDYFRRRVMFPIIDVNSNVVGFGGRAMDNSEPKYLNSADTPAFKKSRTLYALNFAKNSRAEYMIICEGYMDVIAMHQAGFTNAVASLGTAVTPDHARIIARYAKKALLAYDSDEAGRRAGEKAASLLKQADVEVRVLSIKDAKDPDEFIKKFGKERFKQTIDSSKNYTSHSLDLIYEKYDAGDPSQKARALSEACALLLKIESYVERDVYASAVARRWEVSESAVQEELKRLSKRREREARGELFKKGEQLLTSYGDRVNREAAVFPEAVRAEEQLIGILLSYPEDFKYVKGKITPGHFSTGLNRRVFERLCAELADSPEGFDIAYILRELTADEAGRVTGMALANKNRASRRETLEEDMANIIGKHEKRGLTPAKELQNEAFTDAIRERYKNKADGG